MIVIHMSCTVCLSVSLSPDVFLLNNYSDVPPLNFVIGMVLLLALTKWRSCYDFCAHSCIFIESLHNGSEWVSA